MLSGAKKTDLYNFGLHQTVAQKLYFSDVVEIPTGITTSKTIFCRFILVCKTRKPSWRKGKRV